MPIDRITWLCLRDGELLTARTKGKTAWLLPGGKREAGETDLQTLVREIREELSVDILPDTARLYGVFEGPASGKPEGTTVRLSCYTAEYSGTPAPASEIGAIRWLRYRDIGLAPEADVQIYEDLHAKGLLL